MIKTITDKWIEEWKLLKPNKEIEICQFCEDEIVEGENQSKWVRVCKKCDSNNNPYL